MEIYEVKVWGSGTIEWYKDGLLSRLDGPAIELINGDKYWYLDGKRHRLDGPAVETSWHKGWFLNGVEYTEEEHAKLTAPDKELTMNELEDILGYKVKIIK